MTNISLAVNGPCMLQFEDSLFPANGNEAGAVILLGINDHTNGPRGPELQFLTHEVVPIPADEIVSASPKNFSWRKRTFLRVLQLAIENQMAIGFIHSHRGNIPAYFSDADNNNDADVAELVHNRSGGQVPFVSIVIDESGTLVGRTAAKKPQPFTLMRSCAVSGKQWRWHHADFRPYDNTPYDRQVLAFGPEFLESFRYIRIGIVGAGATGSATATLLARIGAADIHSIDPDVVEHTNISRLHSANVTDADLGIPKVQALMSHIQAFGLGTSVSTYQTWAGDSTIRDVLKSFDVIFGCTDDHAGRLFLNRFAYFYNIPYVDMGITIDPRRLRSGVIASADARVTVVGPGNPCLICRRVIDPIRARNEQLARDNPDEYERQLAEGYIAGHNVPNPAVITMTTEVACMAIDEVTARLTGYREVLDNRVRKYRLAKDTRPGVKCQCNVCGDTTYWGRGDMHPFLDRVN